LGAHGARSCTINSSPHFSPLGEKCGLGLPFTHKPQYHNKGSSIIYQGVADTHVLHGSIALP
ncbi:MAG: hypothetical protein U9Q19_03910, partial [Pseudomonadota bacterium]|nr:hypothetical protein [Pseudomonadota bacterium]